MYENSSFRDSINVNSEHIVLKEDTEEAETERGVDLSTEKKESDFIENWFNSNTKVLLDLMDKKGVDVRGDNTVFEKKVSESPSPSIDECIEQIEKEEALKAKAQTPKL